LGQVSAVILVVGIICLALGVAAGYGMYAGKTMTTSIVQTATIGATQTMAVVESMNVTQTSTITETQTTTAVEKVNVTVTPNCCVDANLNNATPCSTIGTPNYPPVQRLQYLVETEPEFIAAENGSNYVTYYNGCGSIYSIGGSIPNGTYVYFSSSYAIDRLYTDDCGDVGNFTYYLDVAVPLTETGYNMTAIQISPINSSEITLDCSSTFTTTENTTITITSTSSA
jgi:hypothetical protein